MVLTQPEIRRAVQQKTIAFDPPLEESQWGEASVDLRLGFQFTMLESIPGFKVSISRGLSALAKSGFWKDIELAEFNQLQQRQTFVLEPKKFVLALTYENINIPRNLIGLVEGRSTYARVGLSMHQTAPWIQPGWKGAIVLEMMNDGPLEIELTPLIDRPCQLTFLKLNKALPKKLAYGSKAVDSYQGQSHPLNPQTKKA